MMEGWNWDHMRMLIFRVMEILLIISCLSENINLYIRERFLNDSMV
jgi:hypothetical protein